jgi:hypothetical protein
LNGADAATLVLDGKVSEHEVRLDRVLDEFVVTMILVLTSEGACPPGAPHDFAAGHDLHAAPGRGLPLCLGAPTSSAIVGQFRWGQIEANIEAAANPRANLLGRKRLIAEGRCYYGRQARYPYLDKSETRRFMTTVTRRRKFLKGPVESSPILRLDRGAKFFRRL